MEDGLALVPAVDSTANLAMRHVVGNKGDDHNGDSIMAEVHAILENFHSPCLVYPTLAVGTLVESHANAWELDAFAEVVPINTITTDIDIHHVSVEALTANDVYELFLYAVEVFIGHVRFTKNAQQDGTMNVPFQCVIIPANTQIQAKLASGAGGSDATISIFYHPYV